MISDPGLNAGTGPLTRGEARESELCGLDISLSQLKLFSNCSLSFFHSPMETQLRIYLGSLCFPNSRSLTFPYYGRKATVCSCFHIQQIKDRFLLFSDTIFPIYCMHFPDGSVVKRICPHGRRCGADSASTISWSRKWQTASNIYLGKLYGTFLPLDGTDSLLIRDQEGQQRAHPLPGNTPNGLPILRSS